MSSYEYAVAPRAVDVLPTRVGRRLSRRDGLLPLVLSLELAVGVAFGIAAHAGDDARSAPARLTLAPVALVTVLPSAAPAVATVVASVAPPVRRHAPRNPFGSLARTPSR